MYSNVLGSQALPSPANVNLNTSAGDPTFAHDPQLWFRDGSVILVCESIGFRVNESVLSMNFLAFKDMFSTGNSSPVGEMYEGCPVVRLTDNPTDMRNVVMMMYDRGFGRGRRNFTLAEVRGILRIASKYQAFGLRNELVEYLTLIFPAKIEIYRSTLREELLSKNSQTLEINPLIGVEIALEFDIPIILPCALFLSSLIPLKEVLCGSPSPDGSLVQSTPSMREQVILFRDALSAHINRDILNSAWFRENKTCVRPQFAKECSGLGGRSEVMERYLFPCDIFGTSGIYVPSEPDFPEEEEPGDRPCIYCVQERNKMDRDMYQPFLWSLLPFFCADRSWKGWSDVQSAQDVLDQLWAP